MTVHQPGNLRCDIRDYDVADYIVGTGRLLDCLSWLKSTVVAEISSRLSANCQFGSKWNHLPIAVNHYINTLYVLRKPWHKDCYLLVPHISLPRTVPILPGLDIWKHLTRKLS